MCLSSKVAAASQLFIRLVTEVPISSTELHTNFDLFQSATHAPGIAVVAAINNLTTMS